MEDTIVNEHVSLKNILYATDFSPYSDAALPFAFSIARKYGSKIFAVHIVSLSPFAKSSPTQVWQALTSQAVREASEAMKHLEGRWNAIPHETLIRRGEIWTELSKVIEEKNIDLVISATRGRTGVSKALLGSVAENIYRHASCPVLTIGPNIAEDPESLGTIHSVLYPTDFTSESLAAAPYAVSLARENQARLYLLHVTEEPIGAVGEDEMLDRLYALVPPAAGLSCAPKALVRFGEPAQKITDLAEEFRVDLIVLGPKGAPVFPGFSHLPGTTAHHIISRAICPILTVRGRA